MLGTPNFDYQNVSVEFVEGSYRDVVERKRQSGRENTMFSFRSPYRYNNSLNVTESRATSEIRLNNYGATSVTDLDDKMSKATDVYTSCITSI